MEEQFEYMIDEIRQWIESGDYKKEPSVHFDEQSNETMVDYIAGYDTDEEDENGDPVQMEIPLTVFLKNDNVLRIELNKGLFDLYYRGYETPEDLEIIEGFLKYASERVD